MRKKNREDSPEESKTGFGWGMWLTCGLIAYVGSFFVFERSLLWLLGHNVELILESDLFITLVSVLYWIYLPLSWIRGLLGL